MTRLAVCLIVALTVVASTFAVRGADATLATAFAKFSAGSTATIDHSSWSKLLAAYVTPSADGINRVHYANFKRNGHAALKSYISGLERADVASLDRPEQFAFWANLYNAKTVDIVLDAYPVRSIKDIKLGGGGLLAAFAGGPWAAKVVTVADHKLSLDDIEHEILRPLFHDARVHYAVNCASLGCPNLAAIAMTGATLDAQLTAAARAYVNNPRGVTVAAGNITASSLYKWYGDDFAREPSGILGHLSRYAEPALKRKLTGITAISAFDYDWSLNDAGS